MLFAGGSAIRVDGQGAEAVTTRVGVRRVTI